MKMRTPAASNTHVIGLIVITYTCKFELYEQYGNKTKSLNTLHMRLRMGV